MHQLEDTTGTARVPHDDGSLADAGSPIRSEHPARTLAELLAGVVDELPDAPAVQAAGETMTFAELWAAAERVAAGLLRAGVRRHDVVGVFLEPGIDLLVATWGVLRAGAAYLPLAIDYPDERLRYMISDAGVTTILTNSSARGRLEALTPPHVAIRVVDGTGTVLAGPAHGASSAAGAAGVEGEADAYVIYTSGSTGRPKGVAVTHAGVVNQLAWLRDEHGLRPGARILLKTPTSFDAAQWELLANATGATVVIGAAGTHRDTSGICDLVRAHEVTMLQCVPTLWSALADEPAFAGCASLTHLFSGGELLSASLAARLQALHPDARVTNLYGPTETTINVTAHTVCDEDLHGDRAVPIGRPARGCWIMVLDASQRPVAEGQTGELCVGGVQLARGYLNRPELTAERFPHVMIDGHRHRLYRTGDLGHVNAAGTIEFAGRIDDQVKVNGHRIETDEVRLAIEDHHWVKTAAVVPWTDQRTGADALAAFVTLDPEEAPLMDQDRAAEHHRSKASHHQVRAQLAHLGVRHDRVDDGPALLLPRAAGCDEQRRAVFARKTYRTYEGEPVSASTLVSLMERLRTPGRGCSDGHGPHALTDVESLADLLRWLGPFHSEQRLLPKYAYASPGALNATQVYVEVRGVRGVDDGIHYYHPHEHSLRRVADGSGDSHPGLRLHLVGLPHVVESVYAVNVHEVLAFEAGHMLGVLEVAAREQGATLEWVTVDEPTLGLEVQHVHSATVDLVRQGQDQPPALDRDPMWHVEALVQVHGTVEGLRRGLYSWSDGGLHLLGDEVVERKHVVAINQESFGDSSFGVALRCPEDLGLAGLTGLGWALHRLQDNRLGVGLMSAGYSSLSGRDLPSAVRLSQVAPMDARRSSYFAIGGPVSEQQVRAQDMREDAVHVRGPQEILRDELRLTLPQYMIPSRVEVVDSIPSTNNGKVDRKALTELLRTTSVDVRRGDNPPTTPAEVEVARCWAEALGEPPSDIDDDFFEVGGNSIAAVRLVHLLNTALETSLPVQALFEAPTVRQLTALIESTSPHSRLIELVAGDPERGSVVMWPGLGGYPMNLRGVAELVADGRPVHGVQACGLNPGECLPRTLGDLVRCDVDELLDLPDTRPLTLVGYSFGARVALEVGLQLLRRGRLVERVVLLAPGSPVLTGKVDRLGQGASFDDPYFREILASVFLGVLPDAPGDDPLHAATDRDAFTSYLLSVQPRLDSGFVERTIDVVLSTYAMRGELWGSTLSDGPPLTIVHAAGDGPSFLDHVDSCLIHCSLTVNGDHYQVLRGSHARAVADAVLDRTSVGA